ncbi:hypothetical protein [Actinomyces radicidentis]|uniref:hypothetical protein n=1 Tax=Actinomyces radicidentis TaxID=111015 RepID=UPI0026E11232|nr:hypothetical protein [Actinomyces radicidentis]
MMKIGLAAATAALVLGLSVTSQPAPSVSATPPAPTQPAVSATTPVAVPLTGSLLIGAGQAIRPENNFLCRQCPWIFLVCRR